MAEYVWIGGTGMCCGVAQDSVGTSSSGSLGGVTLQGLEEVASMHAVLCFVYEYFCEGQSFSLFRS